MHSLTLKEAYCRQHNVSDTAFDGLVLKESLFLRVRIVTPLIRIFNPHYLFNEKRLVQKVGRATNLREVQEEVDFYQHKYVVAFLMKDAFRFRLSGMRLMSVANKAFRYAAEIDEARVQESKAG